jgi:hypothetical protein
MAEGCRRGETPCRRHSFESTAETHERTETMKTMTCKQLGGPCDFALHGESADDVIKAQDKHLQEMVAGGDDTHSGALGEMKGRWKRPLAGMKWYKTTKREFAALPEG